MAKKIAGQEFLVEPGTKIRLKDFDPGYKSGVKDKGIAKTVEFCTRIGELQFQLYAEQKKSLMIVLQAMDTGGKDGVIRHVIGAMNPQACRVAAFKQPSAEELAHDFLWRIEHRAPKKGEVVVFNRSHYEDVLIARVHNLVPKSVWSKRFDQINDFEKRLAANGTHILKFFLNISPEEQLERFSERLDDPARQWKISEADYSERELWPDYQAAYQDVLAKCSTEWAPWYIIPANHKWFRNLAISEIIVECLEGLNLQMPTPTVDIAEIRRKFHEASQEAK